MAMNQNDFKKFSHDIVLLAEVHGKTVTAGMVGIYFKVLEEYNTEAVNMAMTVAVKTLKFFPKPAELIEIIESKNQTLNIEDRALMVSTRIISHMRAYGGTKLPDLEDDPIARDLMTRRWPYLNFASSVLESELKWWQKEFMEAYRVFSETSLQITSESQKLKQIVDGIFGG